MKKKNKLRIIPLGGVGEIGKNMTAIEYGNDLIVIDCGLCFPREDMLGVDYVIPNTAYLEANKDKLRAFFITHGHEDHIGGTPYILNKFNVPVYGTRLTLALIQAKLDEHAIDGVNLTAVNAGESRRAGCFHVEFIRVNHSIDDALALAIHTPVGTIVHTGDFKVDYTPVNGRQIDLIKFAELGRNGVLALMSDSTNAEVPGYTDSEKNVGASFESIFKEAKGRIIVATFASNIHRLQQVVDQAKRNKRKICLMGRSMVRFAEVATELGYLKLSPNQIVNVEDIGNYNDSKLVILTTGSQGESMSGLVRMASGMHSRIVIKQGDTVVLSSSPIPGNERYIADVINMIFQRGAKVVYGGKAQVHVSGHACREELKLILSLTNPKFFIPVHGEPKHLCSHAGIAEELGIKKSNIFIPSIGIPVELTQKTAEYGEEVPSGSVLIDGLGIGDVGNVVLRDRQLLSAEGLFIVVVTISKADRAMVAQPDIISRGFVYMRESEEMIREARDIVTNVVMGCLKSNNGNMLTVKTRIKKTLASYLYDQTKRSPMILPIIIEV